MSQDSELSWKELAFMLREVCEHAQDCSVFFRGYHECDCGYHEVVTAMYIKEVKEDKGEPCTRLI